MTPHEKFAKMRPMGRKWVLCLALILAAPITSLADYPGSGMLLLEPVQPETPLPAGTQWKDVYGGSARFLSFQHVYRIAFQEKTRRFLGGPFFKDYADSVKGLGGWRDGDNLYTNYVLHPLQGAASGFVFLQSNPNAAQLEFGNSRAYWQSRVKALVFAAIYGTQFELGLLSEASIGNVGKTKGTMGLVDLVITPIGGFAWILVEDAVDRFVIRKLEQKLKRKGLIRFLRVVLNPTRSFANVMRLKLPWHRPGRELNRLFEEMPREDPPGEFLPLQLGPGEEGMQFFEALNVVLFVPA